MAVPIVLWNPELSAVKLADDAGVKITKTTLPLLHSFTPRYRTYDPVRSRSFTHIPRLASFCIRVLSQYPEQLHQLGATRLHFHSGKDGTDSVLRSVLPKWRTPSFSLLDVDPRLWATIIQIYSNPPDVLSSYPCQLSDPHVPLLNQIPFTPDFSLITVLDLTDSSNITDSNILSLKVLHNLTALDVSRCYHLSARGIGALSRTVAFNELGEKRGPWMLRVLRMRSCWGVDRTIFDFIHSFPLLAVLDLRGTRCQKQDVKRPFFAADDDIFDISLVDAVNRLSQQHKSVFPSENPYVLSLKERPWPNSMIPSLRSHSLPEKNTMTSRHNNFVILPPSRGSTISRWGPSEGIRFGNTDASDFQERERRQAKNNRDTESDDEWSVCECWEEYACDRCQSEGSAVHSEPIDDLDSDGRVSDTELLYALRESIVSRNEERNATRPLETVLSTPQEGATRIDQQGAGHNAAPVDTFYQKRRPLTTAPPLQSVRRRAYGEYDLALLRVPPAWYTLETITTNWVQNCQRSLSSVGCGDKEARVASKRRQLGEASMKALHTELAKRRRIPSTVNELAQRSGYSPPPSPTRTVYDPEDRTSHREPPLRPISNLQPPSLLGRPRLKLDAAVKASQCSSRSRPDRFTAVAKRRIDKSRNTSLVEEFEQKNRKPSLSVCNGAPIKPSASKCSGNANKREKRPECKRRKKETDGKVNGFDWERWSEATSKKCSARLEI